MGEWILPVVQSFPGCAPIATDSRQSGEDLAPNKISDLKLRCWPPSFHRHYSNGVAQANACAYILRTYSGFKSRRKYPNIRVWIAFDVPFVFICGIFSTNALTIRIWTLNKYIYMYIFGSVRSLFGFPASGTGCDSCDHVECTVCV